MQFVTFVFTEVDFVIFCCLFAVFISTASDSLCTFLLNINTTLGVDWQNIIFVSDDMSRRLKTSFYRLFPSHCVYLSAPEVIACGVGLCFTRDVF